MPVSPNSQTTATSSASELEKKTSEQWLTYSPNTAANLWLTWTNAGLAFVRNEYLTRNPGQQNLEPAAHGSSHFRRVICERAARATFSAG